MSIDTDNLSSLNLLIDKAKSITGSDYKTAQELGVPFQAINAWRHGRRACVPEDQALIALIAGLDPTQVLARAMVEKYEGTPKGDRLMHALGKLLLVTGAASGSAGASAMDSFSTTISSVGYFIRCILC